LIYPRSTAVHVLTRVLTENAAIDEAIDRALESKGEPGVRAWLLEVCSGTLRWKGRLDLALDSVALKTKPTGWLRKVLLIAAYQLIVQERTSPKSVVIETVDEVRKREGEAPAKFANAVLRKLADHAAEWRAVAPVGPQEASLPEWIWTRARKQRGKEWTAAFALACLERPRTWVRKRDPAWAPEWAEATPVGTEVSTAAGLPADCVLAAAGGAIPAKEGFAEGQFIVQDVSSQQLVAHVARLARPTGGEPRALDLCAAPGGKSVGLSWSGFAVTATDESEGRRKLLQQTIDRVGAPVKVIAYADVGKEPLFDLVWVDAPCTGSGIIRRHPEVRWSKGEKELASLMAIQRALLRQAWELVRPGGAVMYSVCSILEEEGRQAVRDAGLEGSLRESWLLAPQLAPGGDGFFGAFLAKS
jgi:16S rRNA (cytosine967-C5)-methyltransferase